MVSVPASFWIFGVEEYYPGGACSVLIDLKAWFFESIWVTSGVMGGGEGELMLLSGLLRWSAPF